MATQQRAKSAAVPLARVGIHDIGICVGHGIRDWVRAPVVSIAIAAIYTFGGWALAVLMVVLAMPYLVYPLAMGFALIAPFVAIAFYDVSRRLQAGAPVSVSAVWQTVNEVRRRDVRWMALITAFAFFIWMDIAAMLTLSFFGAMALDFDALLTAILTTQLGWVFLIVGHVVGAVIAFLVFSIAVISFPMLYDRDVDVMTAMITSVRLVRRNPIAMTVWCGVIAVAIAAAIASALLLLPLVLPVLGYATWHLYQHAVAAAPASE
ncbi:MAG: DUF2189 domain-containing protein [Pseudomonadota bacterium]